MIDYLKFLFYYTIVPMTPTCVILLKMLDNYIILYEINYYISSLLYVIIFALNAVFWGTLVYKYKTIENLVKKIWRI